MAAINVTAALAPSATVTVTAKERYAVSSGVSAGGTVSAALGDKNRSSCSTGGQAIFYTNMSVIRQPNALSYTQPVPPQRVPTNPISRPRYGIVKKS